MRKFLLQIVFIMMASAVSTQVPQGIGSQVLVYDQDDYLLANTLVGLKVIIAHESQVVTKSELASDYDEIVPVYAERHVVTTNTQGLVSFVISEGTVLTGTFSAIDWLDGPYFTIVGIDPTGGDDYVVWVEATYIASVPYVFHADQAAVLPAGAVAGEMQYWDGQSWASVAPGANNQVFVFTKGRPAWVTNPATFSCGEEVTFVYRGEVVTYGSVERHGLCWLDRNLGAAQVPTTKDDPDGLGDLFQWGRGDDGHQLRGSPTTAVLSTTDQPGHGSFIINAQSPHDWRSPKNDMLWQGTKGVNNPCPTGWRLPTETELIAERDSWSPQNAAGAWLSSLKWPLTNTRLGMDGSISSAPWTGYIWSSTADGDNSIVLGYNDDDNTTFLGPTFRASANAVRCVRDL